MPSYKVGEERCHQNQRNATASKDKVEHNPNCCDNWSNTTRHAPRKARASPFGVEQVRVVFHQQRHVFISYLYGVEDRPDSSFFKGRVVVVHQMWWM